MEGARPSASLRPVGGHRLACALLVATLAATALSGCRGDAGGTARPGPSADTAQTVGFRSSNGLIFPPELWSAVGASREAQMLRALAAAQLGQPLDSAAWSATDTSSLLADESSPLEAAWLTAQGPRGAAPRLTATGSMTQALSRGEWLEVWMADDVARLSGAPLALGADDRRRLEAGRAGDDVLGQHVSAAVLARADGASTHPLPPLPDRARTGSPREAALLLMLRATGGEHPDTRNGGLVPSLLQAARTDDWTLYYLTRAHAAVRDLERARGVVAAFDTRRLLPGGTVLEVPAFNGSVGSTFRMVRYHASRGDLDGFLGKGGRAELVDALSTQRGVDTLHALAVTATLTVLDPSSVPAVERAAVVEDAATELIPGDGPMTLEQAVAWTQLAEYARAMEVPMPYRGLTPETVTRWQEASPSLAAPTLSRFLRARGPEARTDPQVRELLPVLRSALTGRAPADIESSILVPASLALHEIEGTWLLPQDEVSQTVESRWDGCRGDFDGYLRESGTDRAVCNVDDSLAALDLTVQTRTTS